MHPAVITQILAIHAISGCDTVAACYGIGKTTTVTISKKGFQFLLNSLSAVDVLWDDVVKETTEFMVAAYGGSGVTMSECRQCLCMQKTARSTGAPVNIRLPLLFGTHTPLSEWLQISEATRYSGSGYRGMV